MNRPLPEILKDLKGINSGSSSQWQTALFIEAIEALAAQSHPPADVRQVCREELRAEWAALVAERGL